MAASKINYRAPEPPYKQIAADLIRDIEAGTLEVGSPLPSESELVERYGVARNTVRNAVAHLRDGGFVETVPKRGSYVRARDQQAPNEGASAG
ncbi:GntR family transcriptional regulator [Streptomyces sp. ISL-11]|uniref:GntR family transcriptional regulator n=1 Tax=Streptomyces sp. ISL-11 TaxID=2819174 RepID=UPI001BE7DA4E|nr:winged helix-turn-helix domain-containing protein [Streptomyces sp. ISL-11]MBT2383834.1 winged helix-turn-helix transcriptional regulator [Streptomyces sp. ISL-11]